MNAAGLRRELALARLPEVDAILERSGFADLAVELSRRCQIAAQSPARYVGLLSAQQCGAELWAFACEQACGQSGDRFFADLGLYYTRLRCQACLGNSDDLLRAFEAASRNGGPVFRLPPGRNFHAESDALPALWISGFDPYRLEESEPASLWHANPSGAAALALHGQVLPGQPSRKIQAVVWPVRFADCDAGLIEQWLERGPGAPAWSAKELTPLLFTISMGSNPDAFHIDRFLANWRGVVPDNAGRAGGPSAILGDAPAFLEHTLAPKYLRKWQADAHRFGVRDHREVDTLEAGRFACEALAQVSEQNPRCGGGGDYLSNELPFRVLAWRRGQLLNAASRGSSLASIARLQTAHIHTPRIGPVGGPEPAVAAEMVRRGQGVVAQIQAMLAAAVRLS